MPYATENHQEYNARVLVNAGAAKIILDKDLDENTLSDKIAELMRNKETLLKMGQNAKRIETKNVEEKIYQEIRQNVLSNKVITCDEKNLKNEKK